MNLFRQNYFFSLFSFIILYCIIILYYYIILYLIFYILPGAHVWWQTKATPLCHVRMARPLKGTEDPPRRPGDKASQGGRGWPVADARPPRHSAATDSSSSRTRFASPLAARWARSGGPCACVPPPDPACAGRPDGGRKIFRHHERNGKECSCSPPHLSLGFWDCHPQTTPRGPTRTLEFGINGKRLLGWIRNCPSSSGRHLQCHGWRSMPAHLLPHGSVGNHAWNMGPV